MAARSVWDNWHRSAEGPLRPGDLPSKRELEQLWRDSEEAVWQAAWAPDAPTRRGYQPQRSHTDSDRPRSVHLSDEQIVFEHVFPPDE